MFVPGCLPFSLSWKLTVLLIYSALVIELAQYGVEYVSDSGLNASCNAMADECHRYMIAPVLDYEPSPYNAVYLR